MLISHRVVKVVVRLGIVLLGPVLLASVLVLLPPTTPARAASEVSWSPTTIQSSSSYTIYLPVIYRAPTPEEQLVDLINAERSGRGLSPLSPHNLLMQVAEAHSQDMIDRNFFSHTNPDGQDPGDRLTNAGYNWQAYGENIGGGYTTPQAMFTGWMNSSGHRANMLNTDFTQIGIGYVTGGLYGHYWTAIFARPAP